MKLKSLIRKFRLKIKEFFSDEYGGNLIEYALLVGFALFVFFIIIGVVTSMLDWTVGLSNDFFDLFK
ncbi:MAG: Flp family type IVb pilin [Candidatus Thorarchaeota archaeon]